MASLLLLIPLGLALLGVAVWAFFWAADHGQFDDLDTPATRILEDDSPAAPPQQAAAPTASAKSAQRLPASEST